MRVFKLTIAYDGTDFVGWQIQPNGPSVQQRIADAVKKTTGEIAIPVAAGRTDSGVHAIGQAAALRLKTALSPPTLQRALNANLPSSIRILELAEASPTFDPVRQARSKWYRYVYNDGVQPDVFANRHSWVVHYRLDVNRMRKAAEAVPGRRDFRVFESEWPNRATSVRTVSRCRPYRFGDFIYLDVEADGFLYNMVRAIAGTLYEIGRGKWPVERMQEILNGHDRALAGPTAPPEGLFLMRVDYE